MVRVDTPDDGLSHGRANEGLCIRKVRLVDFVDVQGVAGR